MRAMRRCCLPSRACRRWTTVEGVHVMTFQTAASSYLWLNDVLAIGEGTIDVEHARLAMRYYECRVELPLEPYAP